MKNYLFGLLFFMAACTPHVNNTIIIDGKVNGDAPLNVFARTMPESACPLFLDSVALDSAGSFHIEMQSEHPVFAFFKVVGADKMFFVSFIAEPNEQPYKMIINADAKNRDSLYFVNGLNKDGIDLSKAFQEYTHIQAAARPYLRDSTLDLQQAHIAESKSHETYALKQLLDEQKISAAFYELAMIDRDCYYNALQATLPYIRSCMIQNTGDTLPANYRNLYAESVLSIEDDDNLTLSPWWSYLADYYIDYKSRIEKELCADSMKYYYANDMLFAKNIEIAERHLVGDKLELYMAYYIYYNAIQENFEKSLIKCFDDFKARFPQSRYTKYIEPEINKIVDYYAKIEAGFGDSMRIVDNYENISSFKDLMSRFKGKKVFVDVWATWCGSCKQEFAYRSKLSELLHEKGYESLYISIDRKDRENKWKENIIYFGLDGSHIRTNEALNKDLRKLYGQKDGAIYIPWYMIVDENGDVVNYHAPSPSKLDELKEIL